MIKTCEEYVLLELDRAHAQIEELEKINKELNSAIKEMKENPQEMKCIYLEDTPNYYYSVHIESEYNWNKILVANGETPELAEKALINDEALEKLCSLKEREYSWGSDKIGYVKERIYNYRFKLRNGQEIIFVLYDNDHSVFILGKGYFLSEEEALNHMYQAVRKNIDYYLKNYKDKFEWEKMKNE